MITNIVGLFIMCISTIILVFLMYALYKIHSKISSILYSINESILNDNHRNRSSHDKLFNHEEMLDKFNNL